MTTLLPKRVPLYRNALEMLFLAALMPMDSLGGFLSVTTVAAIVISHPFAAKALTAQEIAQITMPTAVQMDIPLVSGSGIGIEPGKVDILQLARARNAFLSSKKDRLPPRPSEPGGSR